jgi:hypothetical protein
METSPWQRGADPARCRQCKTKEISYIALSNFQRAKVRSLEYVISTMGYVAYVTEACQSKMRVLVMF